MKPELWGKQFWFTIHCIALNYPHQPTITEQTEAINFFKSLTALLPCTKCKVHYTENLDITLLQEAVQSRDSLFAFTVDLHNKVNLMNNKKVLTVDEALREFSKQTYQSNKNNNNIIIFLVIIIVIMYFTLIK